MNCASPAPGSAVKWPPNELLLILIRLILIRLQKLLRGLLQSFLGQVPRGVFNHLARRFQGRLRSLALQILR